MTEQKWAMVKVFLAVLIWGASFAVTKMAVEALSPTALVWGRFGIGAALLWIFCGLRGLREPFSAKERLGQAAMGFLGVTLHTLIQCAGMATASASLSGLIVGSAPIVTALMGALFLGERLRPLNWLGVAAAALGVLLILGRGDLSDLGSVLARPGEMLIAISVFTWSSFTVGLKALTARRDPLAVMASVMFWGWLFSWPPIIWAGTWREFGSLPAGAWGSLLFLGVMCSAAAYTFWNEGLRTLGAAKTGIFLYLNPLFAALSGMILLGEKLDSSAMAGGAVVLLGIWLVNYQGDLSLTRRK